MREIIKMIVVLSLICGISGFILSGLKQGTAQRIEEQVLTYVQGPAIKGVFADYDNDPIADRKKFVMPDSGEKIMIFPAIKGGELVGVAFEQYGKGYGGDVGVMVGFNVGKSELSGIGVTTMKETPGLGTRIAEPAFTNQFVQHPLTQVDLTKDGGDIDAVSGATYSSIGAVTAAKSAVTVYMALKEEIHKAW